MDPEQQRELEQQLRQLTDVINNYAGVLSGVTKSMSDTAVTTQQSADATSTNTQEKQSNTKSVDRLKESQTKAAALIDESSANMRSAMSGLGSATGSFAKALVSNKDGFDKYGTAIDQVGKASFDLGKSFGFLGTILGVVGLGLGKVLALGLKQADQLLKGVDSLSQIGAAGSLTTNELYNMAHQMGLNSQNLEVFTKAADSARGSLIAFNGNAGDGVKTFAKMTAVTAEQRMAFQRLGVSQEELMQRQADYLNLQTSTGQIIDANAAKDGRLQKASLQYAQNLAIISQVTGKNAQEAKEQMLQAKAAVNIQVHQRMLDMKISEAENKGDAAEVERLKKKKLVEDQLLNAAAETGDAQVIAAVQSKLATGNYGASSAVLTRMGVDIDKVQRDNEKRNLADLEHEGVMGKANAELKEQMRSGYERNVQELGGAMAYSDDLAKKFGATLKMSEWTAANANTDFKKANEDATKTIGNPAAGAPPPKTALDPAQEARNKMTQLEIEAAQKVDDMIKSMNPLLGNTGAFMVFAGLVGVAAAALAAIAAVKGVSSLITGVKSMLGGGAGAAPDLPGGLGGTAAGATQVAEDQLLDKNGKPLQGAAKQARLNKLTGGGAYKMEQSQGALRQAGNSFKDVVKGGTALGLAFTAMGAGLAGAVWIVGKALPTLADGFKAFKKVDGKNLIGVGLGMSGLGVGVLAMGVGAPMNALASLAGQDPLEKIAGMLTALQKWKLDRKKIEDNGASVMAFAKAMTAIATLGAISAVGNTYKSIANALTGAFGGNTEPPYKQLQEFSNLNINAAKTKNNATAFTYFSEAMASYKGLGSPTSAIGTAIADSAAKFFKVRPPLDQFLYFSLLNINEKRTKINSTAFIYFSEAMASYRGGEGLISAVSTIAGAKLNELFGQDSAVDAFYNFSKRDFGSKATENAKAFLEFSKAMGILSGGSGSGGGLLGTLATGAAAIAGTIVGTAASIGNAIASALGFGKVVEAGAGFTTVQDSSGKIVKRTGARNWRNNNPGNLNYGDFAKKHKAIGTDGRFAVFPTYEDGRKAKESLLFEGSGYKNLDIARAITRYAPPSENNTTNYINTVSKAAGVPASTPLASLNSTQRQSMLSAMEKVEGFKVGKEEVLKARKGGLFTGPSTGYQMELHGTEMVIPMDQNSIIAKLAANPADMITELKTQVKSDMHKSTSKYASNPSKSNSPGINKDMIISLGTKFDKVIDTIHGTTHINKKILRHSSV